MGNFNIQVDLTKLPGARVQDIQGKKSTRRCVVIPIDNEVGTVADGYITNGPDGIPTMKSFNDVKLNLVAIEYKQQKYGISHGLKQSYSSQHYERMSEEEKHNSPWVGTVKGWGNQKENSDNIGDLPEDDDKDW